jgi:hypothetical protein
MASALKTIQEPARKTKVVYEADVVVVGGGPAGHSAAVAAARNGANTVLVERYGHLGGLATGGLVIFIPHMSNGTKEQQIAGLCQEWIDRLDSLGGAFHPKREELGSSNKELIAYWKRYSSWAVIGNKLRQTVYVDPELLKCVLNDMVEEAGVKLFLHSWGTKAIVNEGAVQGVIFESKSGRQGILGKVIIDATGDGDLLESAGTKFDGTIERSVRSSQLALVFRLGNVDFHKYSEFKVTNSQKFSELMGELRSLTGGINFIAFPSSRNDVVWINNWIPDFNALNVEDLTRVELKVRKMMLLVHDFYKKHFPGYEKSFILDTASQIGTRGSRRLVGEYIFTKDDINSGIKYNDAVAAFPHVSSAGVNVLIPYRSLVPCETEGLLVAGRCFSSDPVANDTFNLIPHCAATGQAAGTAAALAVKYGVSPRQVDYRMLQDCLIKQGIPLPGIK